jgi:hypothetical protein
MKTDRNIKHFPFNEKYRGAFILRMSGMTLKEAGDVLGVSAERVRTMQYIVEKSLNYTAQSREREIWKKSPSQWYGHDVSRNIEHLDIELEV